MSYIETPTLSLKKTDAGTGKSVWGSILNENFDKIDTFAATSGLVNFWSRSGTGPYYLSPINSGDHVDMNNANIYSGGSMKIYASSPSGSGGLEIYGGYSGGSITIKGAETSSAAVSVIGGYQGGSLWLYGGYGGGSSGASVILKGTDSTGTGSVTIEGGVTNTSSSVTIKGATAATGSIYLRDPVYGDSSDGATLTLTGTSDSGTGTGDVYIYGSSTYTGTNYLDATVTVAGNKSGGAGSAKLCGTDSAHNGQLYIWASNGGSGQTDIYGSSYGSTGYLNLYGSAGGVGITKVYGCGGGTTGDLYLYGSVGGAGTTYIYGAGGGSTGDIYIQGSAGGAGNIYVYGGGGATTSNISVTGCQWGSSTITVYASNATNPASTGDIDIYGANAGTGTIDMYASTTGTGTVNIYASSGGSGNTYVYGAGGGSGDLYLRATGGGTTGNAYLEGNAGGSAGNVYLRGSVGGSGYIEVRASGSGGGTSTGKVLVYGAPGGSSVTEDDYSVTISGLYSAVSSAGRGDIKLIGSNSTDVTSDGYVKIWGHKGSGTGYIQLYNDTTIDGDLDLDTGHVLTVGTTQIITSRQTGWGAPTGTATRTTFATSTVTLSELAERVKALIDDLTTHGLIGT